MINIEDLKIDDLVVVTKRIKKAFTQTAKVVITQRRGKVKIITDKLIVINYINEGGNNKGEYPESFNLNDNTVKIEKIHSDI